ncbi:MAG: hypothetical protein ABEL76_13380, partial [Bradymonadaceae bacterium]
LVRPQFDLDATQTGENRLPPTVDHRIEHPVFSIQWVGIERYTDEQSNDVFYAATNIPGPTKRLDDANFFPKDNALDGQLAVPLRPPDPKALVSSGQTRYAIGHLIVVDDRQADGPFTWEVDSEPIVASALQRGRRRQPEPHPAANGIGKAILFVEGRIGELDDDLLKNRFRGVRELQRPGSEPGHFFIVELDVDFAADEILRVYLPDRPVSRSIPLEVSPLFLRSESAGLPRLFPL